MPKLHKNATTTPEMRTFIYQSDLPTAKLARLLNISESTVRKWRKRKNCADLSHVPKHLNTTLTVEQEYVVVQLRILQLLTLDKLLAVCKEFINPSISRAGLQRCLKRHGVSRLSDMDGNELDDSEQDHVMVSLTEKKSKQVISSKASPQALLEALIKTRETDPEFAINSSPLTEHALNTDSTNVNCFDLVQVNVTTLPDFDNGNEQYRLVVASDLESNWLYVDLYCDKDIYAGRRYLKHVLNKSPFHIRRILAGNYKEFMARFELLDNKAQQKQQNKK